MMTQATATPYDALGGETGIQRLVHRFYELMDELPEACTVRQMHPESLQGSAQSLFEFLSGWFGGPALYIAHKGHPRLRMRQALTEQVTDEGLRDRLIETFSQMADHLLNTPNQHGCAAHGLGILKAAVAP